MIVGKNTKEKKKEKKNSDNTHVCGRGDER